MKNDFEYKLYDEVSFPVMIVNEELTLVYSNDAAKITFSSICSAGSISSLLSEEITKIKSQLSRFEVVKLKGKFGAYSFITMIPFVYNKERLAFVFADHSFSVYKSTDGFRDEKSILEAFSAEYGIHSRRISGMLDCVKRSIPESVLRNISPYLNGVSVNLDHINGMVENLMSVLRLQALFAENNVECIELLRFFSDMDKVHGVLDLSELPKDETEILYERNELNSVCSDIISFLLEDSNGSNSVKVMIKQTNSHIILSFSCPSEKRSFASDKVFTLRNADRKNSLFFARRTVERRGGNILFRKVGCRFEVLVSVRRILPQSYSGYLANDNLNFDLT